METLSTNDLNIQSIGQILSDETIEENAKLKAVHDIKKFFKNSSKSFLNVKLASLINNTNLIQSLEKFDKNFLFDFGMSLINYLGRDSTLDKKIFEHLELVLVELKNQETELLDKLVNVLWKRLQDVFIYDSEIFKKIIPVSKKYLEELVLDWTENTNLKWETNFYVKISVISRDMFQALTAILYQFAVKSQGNLRILELIKMFVSSVMLMCQKKQQNFLKLYPKDCCHIVSLLMISPETYLEGKNCEKSVTKNLVCDFLLEKLIEDSTMTLILLSHFPEWLGVLKNYIS